MFTGVLSVQADSGPVLSVQLQLRGSVAEKIRQAAEREGNPITTVVRRLVSVGIRTEEER